MLGPFWDHFGIILGSFWDHVGIILGPFWDHFNTPVEHDFPAQNEMAAFTGPVKIPARFRPSSRYRVFLAYRGPVKAYTQDIV